jgi:hypothetical protein
MLTGVNRDNGGSKQTEWLENGDATVVCVKFSKMVFMVERWVKRGGAELRAF